MALKSDKNSIKKCNKNSSFYSARRGFDSRRLHHQVADFITFDTLKAVPHPFRTDGGGFFILKGGPMLIHSNPEHVKEVGLELRPSSFDWFHQRQINFKYMSMATSVRSMIRTAGLAGYRTRIFFEEEAPCRTHQE